MYATLAQLVSYDQLLYVGRAHLGRQTVGRSVESSRLGVELSAQDSELMTGVIKEFAVCCAIIDQPGEALYVLLGFAYLLSDGCYLLLNVRLLRLIDQPCGSDLPCPEV